MRLGGRRGRIGVDREEAVGVGTVEVARLGGLMTGAMRATEEVVVEEATEDRRETQVTVPAREEEAVATMMPTATE